MTSRPTHDEPVASGVLPWIGLRLPSLDLANLDGSADYGFAEAELADL